MKQKNNAQPVQDVIRKLHASFEKDGMLLGGSMFDKGESAKVVLNAVKKKKSSDDQSV